MLDDEIKCLGVETTTQAFIDLIDVLKTTDLSFNKLLLVDLLSERHPIYKERSSIDSGQMRGYLIAVFFHIGLPQKGLPYILEELETSFSPYVVAASAKAIRGMKKPHPGIAAFLNKSIYNIWQADAVVNYSSFRAPYQVDENSTALKEIFESLKWLEGSAQYILPDLYHLENQMGAYLSATNRSLLADCIVKIESSVPMESDCCNLPSEIYEQADGHQSIEYAGELGHLVLQDQDGEEMTWNDYFKGKYTVLSFFYTKCHNPRKCIQTIYNLVQLQAKIREKGEGFQVQTAAITYDPSYDTSTVLKNYGTNRKFHFDTNNRMFRVSSGMDTLIEKLKIGVNYKGKEVNVHRIELYIINPKGEIERSFLRFQATEDLVLKALAEVNGKVINETAKKVRNSSLIGRLSTVGLPVLIAFFPKCPLCWMSYLNLIGISSIVSIKHQPWLVYVFIGLALFNLVNLYRLAKKRNGMIPFYFALCGTVLLGLNYWYELSAIVLYFGLFLTLISALLNSLSFKLYHNLLHYINEKWLALKYA